MSTDSTDAIDSIDLVRPDELVPEPWKNGAGTTVELAAGPRVNGIALWRFSIATLDDVTTRLRKAWKIVVADNLKKIVE